MALGGGLTDAEHLGATFEAGAASSGPPVLHSYLLRIVHILGSSALDAVGLHTDLLFAIWLILLYINTGFTIARNKLKGISAFQAYFGPFLCLGKHGAVGGTAHFRIEKRVSWLAINR